MSHLQHGARSLFRSLAATFLFLGTIGSVAAQQAGGTTVTAALLSDPHFDPFRDPGKVKQLAAAPVEAWDGIFAAPESPDAAQAYATLQTTCHEKLDDADRSLVLSAFDSAAAAKPAFVLVAGDMLAHAFDCRYRTLLDASGTDARGQADFAAKAVQYQLRALHQRFPDTPVHLALGNNDTDCEDYALDAESRFAEAVLPDLERGWDGISAPERRQAQQDFKRFGSYALPLPAPVRSTRLIVLNDLYLSSDYKGGCGRKANAVSGKALLQWMQSQLADAKRTGQSVWVLAHIPPEVNVYRTYLQPRDLCHGQPPAMFFSSPDLANLLVRYRDTVRVFISGHTHIDEMHLIEATDGDGAVPLKTVPSISPISTNPPAYLLAQVGNTTATLQDYRLMTASAARGPGLRWNAAYDFRTDFHAPAFTADALHSLMQRWTAEPEESANQIHDYQTHVARGLRLLAFQTSWPQQLCAMQHSTAEGFTACACSAKGGLLPPVQNAK